MDGKKRGNGKYGQKRKVVTEGNWRKGEKPMSATWAKKSKNTPTRSRRGPLPKPKKRDALWGEN